MKGKNVVLALGYSHPIEFPIPEGIQIAVEKQTHMTVTGADKDQVGQVAANLRACVLPIRTSRRAFASPASASRRRRARPERKTAAA